MDIAVSSKITVVEWTFNCIAYLFKYLNRLLVVNLIPTFDLLSPLLLKQNQETLHKEYFVGRFTAESLSFLIRKCTGQSLQNITNHIVSEVVRYSATDAQDISDNETIDKDEFFKSCAILYIETMKNVMGTLHSRSENTLNSLFFVTLDKALRNNTENLKYVADFYATIYLDLLEFTNPPENAAILFSSVYEFIPTAISRFNETHDANHLIIPMKVLFALAASKRGSRVSDWPSVFENILKLLTALDNDSQINSFQTIQLLAEPLIEATSVSICNSGLQPFVSYSAKIFDKLLTIADGSAFIPVSHSLLISSQERFQNSAYPFITKFISSHSKTYTQEISYFLSSIHNAGLLNNTLSHVSGQFKVSGTSNFIKSAINRINSYKSSTDLSTSIQLWWDLEVIRISVPVKKSTIEFSNLFSTLLASASNEPDQSKEDSDLFNLYASLIGKLLGIVANMDSSTVKDRMKLVSPVFKKFDQFASSLDFIEGIGAFLQCLIRHNKSASSSKVEPDFKASDLTLSLAKNMLSSSSKLRDLSLDAIAQLYILSGEKVPKLITQCQSISSIPLDLANSRSIPIQIKNLGTEFTVTPSLDKAINTTVINFLFGLLTVKFKPVTDGAMQAISAAAEREDNLVWENFRQWITYNKKDTQSGSLFSSIDCEPLHDDEELTYESVTAWNEIGCSVSKKFTKNALSVLNIYTDSISNSINLKVHDTILQPSVPSNRRFMTLQALVQVAWLAEEHAGDLVPYILGKDFNDNEAEENEENDEDKGENEEDGNEEEKESESKTDNKEQKKLFFVKTPRQPSGSDSSSWSVKERDLLLETFSNFQNPKQIPHSKEFYERLLYLLSYSQVSIQKRALKCISAFKNPIINKYFENLDWLLDNVRFRDELQYLFRTSGENSIHPDEREVIMPLVIRLLFGRSQLAKEGKRAAVVQSLSNVSKKYIREFVLLVVDRIQCRGFFEKPFDYDQSTTTKATIPLKLKMTEGLNMDVKSLRRHMGVLSMMEDLLKELKLHLSTSMDIILECLLYCFHVSQFNKTPSSVCREKTIMNTIFQTGARCLNIIFSSFADFEKPNFTVFFNTWYSTILTVVLPNFYPSNLRYPNVLMNIFKLYSSVPKYVQYLAHDNCGIFSHHIDALTKSLIGDKVVENVIDSVTNIVKLKDSKSTSFKKADWNNLMNTGIPVVLASLPALLQRESTPNYILKKESTLLVDLANAGFITDKRVRHELIQVCLAAMDRPTSKVSLGVKGDMLQSLSTIFMAKDSDVKKSQIISSYHSLSKLFVQFTDVYSRKSLAKLFTVFGNIVSDFKRASSLIERINAFSEDRIGAPDYNVRLETYTDINESLYPELNPDEWKPLLYNFLYYIKDPEELSVREASAYSLRRFIDCFASKPSLKKAQPYLDLLEDIVLPEIRTGITVKDENIRHWYINVLGHLVKEGKWFTRFDDMKSLLSAPGEESVEEDKDDDDDTKMDIESGIAAPSESTNFFRNIISVHIKSRIRALNFLAQASKNLQLSDASIANYLLPITEHYIDYSPEPNNPITHAAVDTISELSRHLSWFNYTIITRNYIEFLKTKPMNMVVNIRLLNAISSAAEQKQDDDEDDEEDSDNDEKKGNTEKDKGPGILLSESLPEQEKIVKFITEEVLPPLEKCLTSKDEEVLRTDVGLLTPIVKFLKSLPNDAFTYRLPGVLTHACQLLRSRSESLRNKVRKVLREVTKHLGAVYFPFLVRELRSALNRGAHLHILGYTIHSLLSELAPSLKPGDLDACVDLVPGIIMEDIFGVIGSEKEAEGYHSKLMEVKKQKSFDTAEIMASNVSLSQFGTLLAPVRTILLYQKLTTKTERKVDELLRRYALGLNRNKESESREVLVLAYELYKMTQDLAKEEEALRKAKEEEEESLYAGEDYYRYENFRVDLDAKRSASSYGASDVVNLIFKGKNKPKRFYTDNLHFIIKFSFELLRRVLGSNSKLLTAENVAGFVPILGEQISSKFEDVQISALRLLIIILRVRMNEGVIDEQKLADDYVNQVLKIVRSAPTTNTELCQAAFQFMTTVLNYKENITIQEPAIAFLLEKIKPDIEEPERYNTTFSFIRAVIGRAFMMPEVYDVIDKVAAVMITNQTKTTRDVCRNTYLEFMTEYPQGKKRLRQQYKFLIDNLQYKGVEGRLSVMELIHQLFQTMDDAHFKEISASFFLAITLVLVNDVSSEAKEYAAILINQILSRAGPAELEIIEKYLIAWINKPLSEPQLLRAGLQVLGMYFTVLGAEKNQELLPLAQSKITEILIQADVTKQEENNSDSDNEDEDEDGGFIDENYVSPFAKEKETKEPSVEWFLVYFALQLFAKIVELVPVLAYSKAYSKRWALVQNVLLYPHAWVRLSATRLMGMLLSTINDSSKKYPHVAKFIATTSYNYANYEDGENVRDISKFSYVNLAECLMHSLQAHGIPSDLAMQLAKNLVFDGIISDKNEIQYISKDKPADQDSSEMKPDNSLLAWIVSRVSRLLRLENKHTLELFESKKACVQFLASIIQVTSKERTLELSPHIIYGFFPFIESSIVPTISADSTTKAKQEHELYTLCQEIVEILRNKIGTTSYVSAYAGVKQRIMDLRAARKKERAIEAVKNPAEFAQKQLEVRSKKRMKQKQAKLLENSNGIKRVRGVYYDDGDAQKKKKKKKNKKGNGSSIAL